MRESIERQFVVPSQRLQVWLQLMNVETVVSWLPLLRSVQQSSPATRGTGIAGASFVGVFEDRVGPFVMRADLRIDVASVAELEEVSIRARGEDRRMRSRIKIDAVAQLSDVGPDQTRVRLSGTFEITGRVATLGAGVIRSKATKVINEFCTNAQSALSAVI